MPSILCLQSILCISSHSSSQNTPCQTRSTRALSQKPAFQVPTSVRNSSYHQTTSQPHHPLTSIIARKRSILSRPPMLKILQPSRIISLIITPPPLIPLLHHNLLRRSDLMTLPIIPSARPRTRSRMALLQLIPRLDTKTEKLPSQPYYGSISAPETAGRSTAKAQPRSRDYT